MSKKKDTKAEKEIIENDDIQPEVQEISIEDQLKKEVSQEKDKFLRLFAEFENYKKRTSKERIELFKTANEELMTVLLPILDDFDRGLAELKKSNQEEALVGMELINNKLRNSLSQKGLIPIVANAGDVFDVELHEAITQIPAPSEDLKGKIIDVIEQGYKLGDKIIRYPRVVVGQ
ncbi:nucleotide exchange factor GrpE [Lutibacter sp.]|uniref:nucleotide exchange factor GrpE n=1 Tax=Lutibacter sp. TaxID=1925666 RepID=UPI003565C870